jgi:hypothetical protein
MTTKGKIKVIKKGTVVKTESSENLEKKSTKAAAREVVSNVTNWVTDFQQRKRTETRQAIEKFFSQHPQTSGV